MNGTKQGSLLLPALCALNVDELLVELGIVCRVASVIKSYWDQVFALGLDSTRDGI